MAAPTVNADECTACGDCVEGCDSNVLALEDVAVVVNPDECTECGTCEADCPSEAITL